MNRTTHYPESLKRYFKKNTEDSILFNILLNIAMYKTKSCLYFVNIATKEYIQIELGSNISSNINNVEKYLKTYWDINLDIFFDDIQPEFNKEFTLFKILLNTLPDIDASFWYEKGWIKITSTHILIKSSLGSFRISKNNYNSIIYLLNKVEEKFNYTMKEFFNINEKNFVSENDYTFNLWEKHFKKLT